VGENPVVYVAAAGLTPRSPVMTERETVEMPVSARMTNWLAVPRSTTSAVPASRVVTSSAASLPVSTGVARSAVLVSRSATS
jgi:hypothetical protein